MASADPLRYAGYRYDEATELYYLMARYYDANVGRFITRDTFHGFEDEPRSLNQYAYTNNNPVMFVDPSGHWLESVKNGAKYIIKMIGMDWRQHTILNTIITFGAGFIGGIEAYKISSIAAKSKIFVPQMSKTISVIVNSVMGTFKGLLKGFITGLGAGRLADAFSIASKYYDFDGAFDKTTIGMIIDNKILQIENYVLNLIDSM
ncbi:RHS repeat-associated core domain-containing protein [Clostridium thermarum]|uniref:RHS repeat-associated core domain-containing protein n=1 Tax=Clostridium thermarum TaxID=1716543 RepID=UPI0013D14540|nr:RHS repeat-associated core domain-containing protein [Clostridium thermarum]